ncbi:MAG: elongation factor G [Oligosphaeraceae bacterium]|nr:elongation factor G [Oligosphaeraceae bacterium]
MAAESPSQIRNLGIIAHIDAGKTTLTERILLATGCLRVAGEVHEGTTVSDYLQQERERGISVVSAAVSCRWRNCQINIVDTPGHIDFTAEVERSLRVMDGVVAVFCAVHGVQAQSETVWRRARRYSLPALAFINKMDREGANFAGAVKQIHLRFGIPAVPVQLPVSKNGKFAGALDLLTGTVAFALDEGALQDWEQDLDISLAFSEAESFLLESLAEADDEILRCYFNNDKPSPDLYREALQRATGKGLLIPVFCGTALQNCGTNALLDGICSYLPPPDGGGQLRAGNTSAGFQALLRQNPAAPACLLVCRICHQAWTGDFVMVRLYSGTVRAGQSLGNSRNGRELLVRRVLRLQAGECCEIDSAGAGDIVGLDVPVGDCRIGDTLCQNGLSVTLDSMLFPEPVVSMTFEGSQAEDREALPAALEKMCAEDPSLRFQQDEILGQCMVAGMGELHLDIVQDRLRVEYGVQTRTGKPQVNYKHTILSPARQRLDFVKQLTPDIARRAGIEIALEPLARGSGISIEEPEMGQDLPQNCRLAILQAVREVVDTGVPGGHPLADMRITVADVSYDANESSELAFLTAARQALVEAIHLAGLAELEPVMRLEVSTPQDHVGNVIADLTARNGRITELDSLALGASRIVALLPLVEMFGYASQLRSLSAGRADFVAEPFQYDFSHADAEP